MMWLEDLITGDYMPFVNADVYRDVTRSTSTPIHTGEQIYLRQNFKELIERHAVNIVGPDPCDVGGIAELKWIAEYADLHGILIAPHGTGERPFRPGGPRSGLRDPAAQLHRLRISDRRSGLVVRHRRGAARPDREGRHDRLSGTGPAWASTFASRRRAATSTRRMRGSSTRGALMRPISAARRG